MRIFRLPCGIGGEMNDARLTNLYKQMTVSEPTIAMLLRRVLSVVMAGYKTLTTHHVLIIICCAARCLRHDLTR